jgi:hypothetical protein
MMSQTGTVFENLFWSQISSSKYQLRGDERVLATLEIDDALDSLMTGEIVGSCRWTFKRSGLIRISVNACAERDNAYSATLKQGCAEQYSVSLPDGKSLTWKRTEDEGREEWAFVDSDGTSLIVFVPMVTDSGYQASIRIPSSGQTVSNLCLLLLLGGYVLVSKYRDDRFKSAIRAAIAWGPS